jgi:hypothetical protein
VTAAQKFIIVRTVHVAVFIDLFKLLSTYMSCFSTMGPQTLGGFQISPLCVYVYLFVLFHCERT